jgi:alkaline phosphatase D
MPRSLISRRDFLVTTAASAALLPFSLRAQTAAPDTGRIFRHSVASGDPLTDRVMLWTRVTPPPTRSSTGPIDVRWRIASDEKLAQVVATGTASAAAERDFTVKVDAGRLQPGRTYYYSFDVAGEQSPVGRTRTLPARGAERLRLASVSCSNYPAGYFNVYRCLANRTDLDAVLHLGDYIYEFANGAYGDGTSTGRVPLPPREATTLADYRLRYATYRTDADLQDAHRLHPFVVVWDDHEIVNDASVEGAPTHKGSPATWADIVMLDTRGLRNRQVAGTNVDALLDPKRTLLGDAQEQWLADQLRTSQRAGTRWRILGQQVIFAPITPVATATQNTDVWDGYPAARQRVFDMLARDSITNLAILTGDAHSSWAMDVPRPNTRYEARTGAGSAAIELVTPAISSPPMFASAVLRDRASLLKLSAPHLKYLDGDNRGYTLLDVTRDRLQADFYHVANVTERSDRESKAASFVCASGSARLERA